jgi:hypothetical protein
MIRHPVLRDEMRKLFNSCYLAKLLMVVYCYGFKYAQYNVKQQGRQYALRGAENFILRGNWLQCSALEPNLDALRLSPCRRRALWLVLLGSPW